MTTIDKIRRKNYYLNKWLALEQIAAYLQMSTSSIYKITQASKISAYKADGQ